ncbi:MAG: hypothetical protein QXX17_05530 [Conexivisphaerales archaeon]
MDRLLRSVIFLAVASVAMVMINIFWGENDLATMLSIYFVLVSAIAITLHLKPKQEAIKEVASSARPDEMREIVDRAAKGDSDARKYIIDSLTQLAIEAGKGDSLNSDEDFRRIMPEEKPHGMKMLRRSKNEVDRKLYLTALENLLDKIANERYS